jgi:hypothetical protein
VGILSLVIINCTLSMPDISDMSTPKVNRKRKQSDTLQFASKGLLSNTQQQGGSSKVNRKRKQSDNPDPPQFDSKRFLSDLEEQGGLSLIENVIWDLVDETGLPIRELQRRRGLFSFSNTTWDDVAPMFGLEKSIGFNQLPVFSYPVAALPPSFHRGVMKASAMWMDVYQEIDSQEREVARVRLMDAVSILSQAAPWVLLALTESSRSRPQHLFMAHDGVESIPESSCASPRFRRPVSLSMSLQRNLASIAENEVSLDEGCWHQQNWLIMLRMRWKPFFD